MLKLKTFLSTICAGVLLLVPVSTVIACGEVITNNIYDKTTIADISEVQLSEEQSAIDAALNTIIKVGVRQQDVTLFEAIAKAFNKLNKGKIEIASMGQYPPDYLEIANATGSIPTVFTSDFNVVRKVQQRGVYAKPFVANDFLDFENKDLYNASNKNISYTEEDF